MKKLSFELIQSESDVENLTHDLSEFIIDVVDDDMPTDKVMFSLFKLASVISQSAGIEFDEYINSAKKAFQEEETIKLTNSKSDKMIN